MPAAVTMRKKQPSESKPKVHVNETHMHERYTIWLPKVSESKLGVLLQQALVTNVECTDTPTDLCDPRTIPLESDSKNKLTHN